MKKYLFLLALSLQLFTVYCLATPVNGKVICHDVLEGEDIGGKFETNSLFDASIPTLESALTITLTGQPSKTTVDTYLNPNSACGVPLDFQKRCQTKEVLDTKFGYSFTFRCEDEIRFGEVYCDENCLSGKSGMSLRCEGPKVDKKFAGAGLVFLGCQFQK